MMEPLVEVKNLKKYYQLKGGLFSKGEVVRAVDDVSFHLYRNEILGLVGESGCGKTTVGKLLLRLIEPTDGKVFYAGRNLLELDREEMRKLRSQMQIIFQDPFASLNPRRTVGQIIGDPLIIHKVVKKDEAKKRVLELLEEAGFDPPESHINKYPHEFSSGQRQRIAILRALAINPEFIVADEPVSALDVSVRAQILTFLKQLRKEFDVTYLFITHDLSVVRSLCNRVVIMYLGKLLEVADVKDIFENPLSPYTQALLSATPIPNPKLSRERKTLILKGDIPSSIDPPSGCRFHTRCPLAASECPPECAKVEPELHEVESNHYLACHQF
jgi:peptide/nickel transport system ATP-binding protein/oligopeptide transport system ATP-binding protein